MNLFNTRQELMAEIRRIGAEINKLARRMTNNETGVLVRYNALRQRHVELYNLSKSFA